MPDQETQSSASSPTLLARVQRLEDLEALHRLKALYARRVDDNHRSPSHASAVAAAALFTENAILDLGAAGRYEGHTAILNAFENIFPNVTAWSTHYIMSPVIDIDADGERAEGTWYFLLYTQPKTDPPSPVVTVWGSYTEKYKKTAQGWKFKEVNGIITAPAQT